MNDLQLFMNETHVDGVMSSEAILENPSLFSRHQRVIIDEFDDKTVTYIHRNQLELAEEYLELVSQYPVNHMRTIRSHLIKMLYRYICIHTELRLQLIDALNIDDFHDVIKVWREYSFDLVRCIVDLYVFQHNSDSIVYTFPIYIHIYTYIRNDVNNLMNRHVAR